MHRPTNRHALFNLNIYQIHISLRRLAYTQNVRLRFLYTPHFTISNSYLKRFLYTQQHTTLIVFIFPLLILLYILIKHSEDVLRIYLIDLLKRKDERKGERTTRKQRKIRLPMPTGGFRNIKLTLKIFDKSECSKRNVLRGEGQRKPLEIAASSSFIQRKLSNLENPRLKRTFPAHKSLPQ